MDDNVEIQERSASDDKVASLDAQKLLRQDHLNLAIQYRAGNLHTFRDGREIPAEVAAAEHERQAAVAEETIRDLEASLLEEHKA